MRVGRNTVTSHQYGAAGWQNYEWHILPRGDRIIEANGSAVLRVCRELIKASHSCGNQAELIADRNLKHDGYGCEGKIEYRKFRDSKLGSILGVILIFLRLRGYRDGFKLKLTSPGKLPSRVYVHNRPWVGRELRRTLPDSQLILYLHNVTMAGTPSYVIRSMLAQYDSVVCVSDYLRSELIKRSNASETDQQRIFTVRNSVDAALYDLEPNVIRDILYVGRVIPQKGLHVLLQALAADELSETKLLVVGGSSFLSHTASEYELACRTYADRHGLQVEFVGPMPPASIPSVMASCRIVAIPSSWDDPCPLVVLEAMASPAAVLATKSGGIPELGDVTQGLLIVEKNSPAHLREAIRELLQNDCAWRAPGRLGQLAVRRRTWIDAYRELNYRLAPATDSAEG